MGFHGPNTVTRDWHVAVGFEDLPFVGSTNEYDYNDWITDIDGIATYDSQVNNGLIAMSFNYSPYARGAASDHMFHLFIPKGTFGSDGTAVLTLFDQNHNVISSQTLAFVASTDNDFVIFPKTSDVFPGVLVNTIETKPFEPPQRYAALAITFTNLAPFNLTGYDLSSPHGEGLFFDPYLHVYNTGEDIHRGDIRMLMVPYNAYLWPEENIRIDKAYPDVTFTLGNPPTIIFPDKWWLNHNHCVYDGVPCTLVKALNIGPSLQTTPTTPTP